MKLRRMLSCALMALLVISSLQAFAFASEDGYHNLYVDLYPDNEDCLQLDALKDAKDATVTITKDNDPSVSVTIPLEYDPDPDWQDMWGQAYLDTPEMKTLLTDLIALNRDKASKLRTQKSIKASQKGMCRELNGNKLRTKAAALLYDLDTLSGYSVTIAGMGDHYDVEEVYAYVRSSSDVQATLDEYVSSIRGFGGKAYENYQQPDTFTQLMEDYAKARGYESYHAYMIDLEYEEEDIEFELDYIAEMDAIMADMKTGTYFGDLSVEGSLTCDCPEKIKCHMVHRYYKVIDGQRKMIYSTDEYVKATVGETLYAKDYVKLDHAGDTYTLTKTIGYYTDEPAESFKVQEDIWETHGGFVFSYDCVDNQEQQIVPGGDDADQDQKPEQPKRKPEVVTGEKGPETGDYTPMAVYLLVLLAAAGGCMAMRKCLKK